MSTSRPSACARDSAIDAGSRRKKTGWTSIVNGPSAGAVSPTEMSAASDDQRPDDGPGEPRAEGHAGSVRPSVVPDQDSPARDDLLRKTAGGRARPSMSGCGTSCPVVRQSARGLSSAVSEDLLAALRSDGSLTSEAVAEAGAHLDVDRRVADRLVVALEVEHHAVASPARKTCSTVKRRLISDLPGSYGAQSLDDSDLVPSPHSHSTARAVELLEVVGAAGQLGREHDARRRHRDDAAARCKRDLRPLGSAASFWSLSCLCRFSERKRRSTSAAATSRDADAGPRVSPQVPHDR